jgi:hypothetical protein
VSIPVESLPANEIVGSDRMGLLGGWVLVRCRFDSLHPLQASPPSPSFDGEAFDDTSSGVDSGRIPARERDGAEGLCGSTVRRSWWAL